MICKHCGWLQYVRQYVFTGTLPGQTQSAIASSHQHLVLADPQPRLASMPVYADVICSAQSHDRWPILHFAVQSCQRNLKTLGKPTIIPGLPELAGLVGQMAAQWEARAQQQATHMDTDAETPDDEADAAAGPETASATDAATTSEAGATTAEHQDATAAAAGTSRAAGSKASAVTPDRTDAQEETETSGAGQGATQSSEAAAGISGAIEADEGPAVDANADASLSDVVADARASEASAGVSVEPDNTNMDAVENRRQKKKKKTAAS